MSSRLLPAALGLLGSLASAAFAALPSSGGDVLDLAHPAIRTFSDREGLPQNTVHAITRDGQGYLWVGTQDGAGRWNGRTWTTIDMPDRQVSNYVRAVLPARDGSVWFGREDGGVVRLLPGGSRPVPPPESFVVYDAAAGLPAPRVNHMLQTRDGEIWAATLGGGAARFTGDRFEAVSEGLTDLRLWALAEIEDDDGRPRLLAGGEGGLFVLDGRRWKRYEAAPALPSVNSVLQTKDARTGTRTLWIGSYGAGVTRVTAGRVTRFGPEQGLESRLTTCLAVTRRAPGEEQVFVATRDAGLFALAGERFARVRLRGSITEIYWIRGGGEDDPGALWVGTRTSGLLRLEPASWLTLDSSSGLPTDQVLGFLETRDEAGGPVYWIGTGHGLAVVHGARISVEGRDEGLPGPQVLALAELRGNDRPPEIWASVVGLGLVRRVGGRWVRVDARPAFNADHGVWLLATRTSSGAALLWVGTERGGLARMEGGRWTVLTTKEGLPSDHIVSLLETEAGGRRRLWVGTRGGGIAEIVDDRVAATWSRASGLPNDDVLSLAEVRLPGGRREVWAGTRSGVARRGVHLGATWTRLGLDGTSARPSETVLSIGQDRAGRIYLGTQRGVVRLTPRAPGATEAGEFGQEVFGLSDGLPSASANWAQLLDSKGRIWIATTAGVALLDPEREAASLPPPAPLVVERAEALGHGRVIDPGVALPPGEHDVAFEYALLTPRRAADVRYRTRLVGFDAAPSAWVAEHARTYTSLPAGRYVFRVEARDAAGIESAPSELPFAVSSYVWVRPWALALEALAVIVLVTAALRFRERRFRRRAASLEALVAERTAQLSAANELLAELSLTDPLTGLANRRALQTRAEEEWRRAARSGTGLAVVMLDVDHFKAYNDTAGHLAGDECLRQVADALRRFAQRPADLVARYGGEEFACLLPGLGRDEAGAHAGRLREAIEELALPHPKSPIGPHVTVSIGVAWAPAAAHGDWRAVLAAADAALYRAKQSGRNRIEFTP
ncbi:MAG: diguanylate cyclase [Vicinamibacteria bacterium]